MRFPSAVTIAPGLIIASGSAAAVSALIFGDIRIFTPTFIIVAVVAVCLGLPVYLAARAARNDTPLMAAVTGFVIGAAIPTVLVLTGAPDHASVGDTATVIDGSYTFAGWMQNFALIGFFGMLGVGGALVFWFIVRRSRSNDGLEEGPSSLLTLRTALLWLAAAGVVAAALFIPHATADRSCHNPLRDGRTSIGQVAGFRLQVGIEEWRSVEDEMESFQRSGDWSVRSDVRTDTNFPWFHISLCKEAGTNISVRGMADSDEISFGVYQPQGGPTWRQDFRALYERINARWPTKVTFTDDQSLETGTPEWTTAPEGP